MIVASSHFEVAIVSAATATVVGVLIEVPLMLMLVKACLGNRHWFALPHSEQAGA